MNIPLALVAGAVITFAPASAGAQRTDTQPASPTQTQSTNTTASTGADQAPVTANQTQGTNTAPAAGANTPSADTTTDAACDATAKASTARRPNIDQSVDPRPESVRSITRDTGTVLRRKPKKPADTTCASQFQ